MTEEQKNRFLGVDIMRGIGFDIANFQKLTNSQKRELIIACEDFIFRKKPFTTEQKNLLWRVRKEYHIRNSNLYYEAEPATWADRLLW